MAHFILSVFFLLIPSGAGAVAGNKGWMRAGGPRAHSTGGRGYLQPPVYCSQHPIPWQGTIPGAPTEVSPGRRVRSTHLSPPWCLRAARNGLRTR